MKTIDEFLKDYPNFNIEYREDGFVAIKYNNLTYVAYRKAICDDKFLMLEVEDISKKIKRLENKNLNC